MVHTTIAHIQAMLAAARVTAKHGGVFFVILDLCILFQFFFTIR